MFRSQLCGSCWRSSQGLKPLLSPCMGRGSPGRAQRTIVKEKWNGMGVAGARRSISAFLIPSDSKTLRGHIYWKPTACQILYIHYFIKFWQKHQERWWIVLPRQTCFISYLPFSSVLTSDAFFLSTCKHARLSSQPHHPCNNKEEIPLTP